PNIVAERVAKTNPYLVRRNSGCDSGIWIEHDCRVAELRVQVLRIHAPPRVEGAIDSCSNRPTYPLADERGQNGRLTGGHRRCAESIAGPCAAAGAVREPPPASQADPPAQGDNDFDGRVI